MPTSMPHTADTFGIHGLIKETAASTPNTSALGHKKSSMDYATLADACGRFAAGLHHLTLRTGPECGDRVIVYLPKTFETVIALFGSTWAGGVMIPVNPVFKAPQVGHILNDSGARFLVTSHQRLKTLLPIIHGSDLASIVLVDDGPEELRASSTIDCILWSDLMGIEPALAHPSNGDDTAAILYTSGSTGQPKGVELSHDNLRLGAASVSEYLENTASDRILAVLPLSFDYGLSQLTTAFTVGAHVQLMDYLLPRDVIRAVSKFQITALAGVPPLWIQLAQLPWPEEAMKSLRYLTNSGGVFPVATMESLQKSLPKTTLVPMYGLTEAFRSTYLPASEISQRPESMGQAIPRAELHVVDEEGDECVLGEIGELVHCGPLVAKGYWQNLAATEQRFRPFPADDPKAPLAVWSGDLVRQDQHGFFYFVGRRDDMIKSSGYRISPAEIEDVLYASGLIAEAAAFGIPHPKLGQAVVIAITPRSKPADDSLSEHVLAVCKAELPAFMVPSHVVIKDSLPRNPNGKIDRKALAAEMTQAP